MGKKGGGRQAGPRLLGRPPRKRGRRPKRRDGQVDAGEPKTLAAVNLNNDAKIVNDDDDSDDDSFVQVASKKVLAQVEDYEQLLPVPKLH